MNDLQQKRKRQLAELSLIYAVPVFTKATENSRLSGLQRTLQNAVLPDLAMLEKMTQAECRVIDIRLNKWLQDIGWWHEKMHISALISFCLDMIERSPIQYNPKILHTLTLIAEHLENGNELPYPSMEEAARIATTWKQVYA